MKKIAFGLVLGMLLVIAGCEKTKDPVVEPDPIDNSINPDDLKEELLKAGMEFVGKIDANDHKNLVDLGEYLIDKYEDYDAEAFEIYAEDLEDAVYKEEYTTKALGAMRSMMSYVFDAIGNNGGATVANVTSVYSCIFDIEFQDICASFYPNENRQRWVLDTSVKDRLELLLHDKNGKDVVLTLKASSATTTVKGESQYSNYREERTTDVVGKIPQELVFTITQDGNELVRCEVSSSLNSEFDVEDDKDCFKVTVEFSQLSIGVSLAFDGYEVKASTDVTPSSVAVASSMKIDGEGMYDMSVIVNGSFNNKTFSDNDDEVDIVNLLKDAVFGCSILDGKVKVNANVPDAYDFYEAYKVIEEADDDVSSKEYPEAVANANKTFTASFSYNGSKQADLLLETFEVEGYRRNYYNIYPVLQFTSDNSKVRVDYYFTEKAFQKLIDACEALEHDFEKLVD